MHEANPFLEKIRKENRYTLDENSLYNEYKNL